MLAAKQGQAQKENTLSRGGAERPPAIEGHRQLQAAANRFSNASMAAKLHQKANARVNGGAVIQRLSDDYFVHDRIDGIAIPAAYETNFWQFGTNGRVQVAAIVAAVRNFDAAFSDDLLAAQFMNANQILQTFGQAQIDLVAIQQSVDALLPVLAQRPADEAVFTTLNTEITTLRAALISELATVTNLLNTAQAEVNGAVDAAWPTHYGYAGAYRAPAISAATFRQAYDAGLVATNMVKWWSSPGFRGHNAELMISIAGAAWGIAHIKWNVGDSPYNAEPFMATFKNADGTSMYGGNIDRRDFAVTHFVAQIIRTATAQAALPPGPGPYPDALV